MTLTDMEFYEADIMYAAQKRDLAKKLWEYWKLQAEEYWLEIYPDWRN